MQCLFCWKSTHNFATFSWTDFLVGQLDILCPTIGQLDAHCLNNGLLVIHFTTLEEVNKSCPIIGQLEIYCPTIGKLDIDCTTVRHLDIHSPNNGLLVIHFTIPGQLDKNCSIINQLDVQCQTIIQYEIHCSNHQTVEQNIARQYFNWKYFDRFCPTVWIQFFDGRHFLPRSLLAMLAIFWTPAGRVSPVDGLWPAKIHSIIS